MKRIFLAFLVFALSSVSVLAAPTPGKVTPAKDGMIKVALVLSNDATVIDFAGPWEVFADTMLTGSNGKTVMPFTLYTVSANTKPIHTEGGMSGMQIVPEYSFANAPIPDIVVVGAQKGGPTVTAWLKKVHAEDRIIMSVCTGAYSLAKAGLLNGKQATTHHWYFGDFSQEYPDIKVVKNVRYVQSTPTIYTAGGETSGIDLALHLVTEYFGQTVAQDTANFMEYQGAGWKTNEGISAQALPITHQVWSGRLASGLPVIFHITLYGASPVFTIDLPSENIAGVATTVNQHGKQVQMMIHIPGHVATFAGTLTGADETSVIGTFSQDGKTSSLRLTKIS